MRKRKHRELASTNAISVDVEGLAALLSCGRDTARKIGIEAEARGKQNIVCSGKSTKISVEYIHLTAIVALLRGRGFKYEKIIVVNS